MTALIQRDRIDGSKPDTPEGVNTANFLLGTGNAWDCLQTLGIGVSSVAAGTATLTQANAGLVLADASAGNVVINLPACSAAIGALFQFKRNDTSANTVTINRAGGDTIDGQTSYTLQEQLDFVEMRSDGTSTWRLLNNASVEARELLSAGTATAYTITPMPQINAYRAGRRYWVRFHTASGASPTLQISGLATPPNLVALRADGTYTNIAAGEIPANLRSPVTLISTTQAVVEELPPLAQQMVRLNTVNGYGSTNAAIRRFTNVVTNAGTAITYADSAPLGASFTINVAGVYAVSYSENFNVAGVIGLSLNSSQLATAFSSITTADKLSGGSTISANSEGFVGWTGYLASGSIVRPHTDFAVTGVANRATFTIARVA